MSLVRLRYFIRMHAYVSWCTCSKVLSHTHISKSRVSTSHVIETLKKTSRHASYTHMTCHVIETLKKTSRHASYTHMHKSWHKRTCARVMSHAHVWTRHVAHTYLNESRHGPTMFAYSCSIDMCTVTHSNVCHDSFMCAPWLIQTCAMTPSCMHIQTCAMTPSCMHHDSFKRVLWLLHVCTMT